MRTGWMAQPRVKEHKAIEVRIVRMEVPGLVQGMVIFYICADLEIVTDPVLDDRTKWVSWGSLGQGEFCVAIHHAFRTNEYEMDGAAGKHIRELNPDLPWKRRFRTGSDDKNPHRWRART